MNPIGMFVNTATVVTPSQTVQTDGSYIESGSGTAVSCSIQPLSASEAVRLGRDAGTVYARGYFPAGTVLTVNTKFLDEDSVLWRVIGRGRDTGGRAQFVTVDLERQT